jgi:hypothetical protein
MKPSPGPISDWLKFSDGIIFVDELNHRLLVEDLHGDFHVVTGDFRYPRAVAVMGSLAYVVDSWNHRVRAFNVPEWTIAFEFGSFFCPSSIAVTGEFLVVADTNNRQLSFHRPDGSRAFTYALDGFPKRVSVDDGGTIHVTYDNGARETLRY